MHFRVALTATIFLSLFAVCDLKARQPGLPAATDVVKLSDSLSEAERVHPSIRAEAQMVEARRAYVPKVKTLPDPTVSVAWMGNNWPFSVQHLPPSVTATATGPGVWQTPARMRKLIGSQAGMLRIDSEGIQFQPVKGKEYRWPNMEIKTFDLRSKTLILQGYQNKSLHRPGEKSFRFELTNPLPPPLAAELARRVAKPIRNGDPDPKIESFTLISVHHHRNFGGSNGTLRFSEGGIDYVTTAGDARSWRWTDLETLSNPDPYHLLVFGYRDAYTFDLKEPLSRALFNRLTDEINSHNAAEPGQGPDVQVPYGSESHGQGAGHE
jgi:hypothetical protein